MKGDGVKAEPQYKSTMARFENSITGVSVFTIHLHHDDLKVMPAARASRIRMAFAALESAFAPPANQSQSGDSR